MTKSTGQPRAPKRETIHRDKPHPNGQAWQWGYDAARDFYPVTSCPFSGVRQRDEWMQGYKAGEAENNA